MVPGEPTDGKSLRHMASFKVILRIFLNLQTSRHFCQQLAHNSAQPLPLFPERGVTRGEVAVPSLAQTLHQNSPDANPVSLVAPAGGYFSGPQTRRGPLGLPPGPHSPSILWPFPYLTPSPATAFDCPVRLDLHTNCLCQFSSWPWVSLLRLNALFGVTG